MEVSAKDDGDSTKFFIMFAEDVLARPVYSLSSMVISSQMISLVAQISEARLPSLGTGQVESWLSDIGILNIEWAVRPPRRRSAALPEDATHNTTHPLP